MRGIRTIPVAVVALLLLSAPASATAEALIPIAPPGSFGSQPVNAAAPPDDTRLFVVEREGGIRVVQDGALLPTPFLTVPNVNTEVERGLLSIAFAPNYASSGLFYVFTVADGPDDLDPAAQAGQIRIVEYRRSATDPNLADADSARLVLALAHSAGNHNGGQIIFGPEGLLYITLGDNANSANAQDLTNSYGKLLRIDPADPPGEATYSVPDSNPIGSVKGGRLATYAYGLRNPYRASFGPNGELIVGDVGDGAWEEIDVGRPTGDARATTLAGANLGWPICEGLCPSPPPAPGLTEPVFAYPHGGGPSETTGNAVLGGYVVRDRRLPGLFGRYLYGDLSRTDLRTLDLDAPGADPRPAGFEIPDGPYTLRGFGEDSRGCVYVITTETVYRVAPSAGAGTACPPPLPPEPPGAAADRRRPGLVLKLAKRQKLRPFVVVRATCDEQCTLSAAGSLRILGAKPSAACTGGGGTPGCPSPMVLPRSVTGSAGVEVALRLRFHRRSLKRARAARRDGRRVRGELTVIAADGSGNATVERARIAFR